MDMKVSIVIPTYNRSDYLKKALESIFKQTYEHSKFECLVIDDFSTDGTKEMIEGFAREADFKILYYRNDKKGQTMARNKGLKAAQGEIVVSTDSDIIADPDWLKNGLAYFADKSISAVEGRIISEGEVLVFYHGLGNENGGTYQTANMFYRKTALEGAGFLDEKLNEWHNFGSDYDLALRIMDFGGRIVFARGAAVHHPAYRLKVSAFLKNSLKSGAIPYLYKKHGKKISSHLGMSLYRAAAGTSVIVFILSVVSFNYIFMFASLAAACALSVKFIHGFEYAGLPLRLKAVFIYSIGAAVNLLAFLGGCLRFKVLPAKGIFKS